MYRILIKSSDKTFTYITEKYEKVDGFIEFIDIKGNFCSFNLNNLEGVMCIDK